MVQDVLAPRTEQRKLYSKYLHVFKKQYVNVAVRMANAIDDYSVGLPLALLEISEVLTLANASHSLVYGSTVLTP